MHIRLCTADLVRTCGKAFSNSLSALLGTIGFPDVSTTEIFVSSSSHSFLSCNAFWILSPESFLGLLLTRSRMAAAANLASPQMPMSMGLVRPKRRELISI